MTTSSNDEDLSSCHPVMICRQNVSFPVFIGTSLSETLLSVFAYFAFFFLLFDFLSQLLFPSRDDDEESTLS